MGSPKPLLDFGGQTALDLCLQSLLGAWVGEVLVVSNPTLLPEIEPRLQGLSVRVVVNSRPHSDMADSLRVGIRSLNGLSDGVLVHLIDHPLVQGETLRALIRAFSEDITRIVLPAFKGKKGHPVLLPSGILASLGPKETLKGLIERHAHRLKVVETLDRGILLDLDTQKDYLEAKEWLKREE